MTGMYLISFRILGFPRWKDNISIQEGIAQDCSRKMGRAKTKGKEKKKKYLMTTSLSQLQITTALQGCLVQNGILCFFQEHPRPIYMRVTALIAPPPPLPASSRSVLPSNQYLFRYILALEFSEQSRIWSIYNFRTIYL